MKPICFRAVLDGRARAGSGGLRLRAVELSGDHLRMGRAPADRWGIGRSNIPTVEEIQEMCGMTREEAARAVAIMVLPAAPGIHGGGGHGPARPRRS